MSNSNPQAGALNPPPDRNAGVSPASHDGVLPPSPAEPTEDIRACWSEIGVYGDQSCADLKKFVHCRNCPAYSTAGVQLLNRPLPADYRREWTAHFARQKQAAPQRNASAVLFRINTEWLALPTPAFQEVAERRRIHSLPHRRRGIVLGLANVRGELLICVSLGHLMGMERLPSPDKLRATHNRLLVVHWDGSRLVFPVDEVAGVHRFNLQEMKLPPATVAKASVSYTQGVFYWQDHAVGFLDSGSLFPALNRSLM
jgi:chemotaxis-related protein WspD